MLSLSGSAWRPTVLVLLCALVAAPSLAFRATTVNSGDPRPKANTDGADVERFRQFLRIPSVSADGPAGPYSEAVRFVRKEAERQGSYVTVKEFEFVRGKPVLLLSWLGNNASAKSVLVNCHYDVVPPGKLEEWEHPPFDAFLDPQGWIWGRGAQDMKAVCMQVFSAASRVGFGAVPSPFRRTLHLLYVPDEEVGGRDGMGAFTASEEFAALNLGLALDEGRVAGEGSRQLVIRYGERASMSVWVTAKGLQGHASRFIEPSAVLRLQQLTSNILELREKERQRFLAGVPLGEVATLTLTVLEAGVKDSAGGYAINVVPNEARAGFDIRIPPSWPLDDWEKQFDSFARQANVTYERRGTRPPRHAVTSPDHPWFKSVTGWIKETGYDLLPEIGAGGTDARFIRWKSIPAFGFSALADTPELLHQLNERVHKTQWLAGIGIYEHLLRNVLDAPDHLDI